jgi:hypothetical protein
MVTGTPPLLHRLEQHPHLRRRLRFKKPEPGDSLAMGFVVQAIDDRCDAADHAIACHG